MRWKNALPTIKIRKKNYNTNHDMNMILVDKEALMYTTNEKLNQTKLTVSKDYCFSIKKLTWKKKFLDEKIKNIVCSIKDSLVCIVYCSCIFWITVSNLYKLPTPWDIKNVFYFFKFISVF
jgi:hypothetical protein